MMLPTWEYKICLIQYHKTAPELFNWQLTIDGKKFGLEAGLEKLGSKGWELAGIQTARTEGFNFPKSYYVFKRPM